MSFSCREVCNRALSTSIVISLTQFQPIWGRDVSKLRTLPHIGIHHGVRWGVYVGNPDFVLTNYPYPPWVNRMTSQLDNGETVGTVRCVNDQDPLTPVEHLTRAREMEAWQHERGWTNRHIIHAVRSWYGFRAWPYAAATYQRMIHHPEDMAHFMAKHPRLRIYDHVRAIYAWETRNE